MDEETSNDETGYPETQVLSSQQMGSWKVRLAEFLGSTWGELLLQLLGCFFGENSELLELGLHGIVGHLASTKHRPNLRLLERTVIRCGF